MAIDRPIHVIGGGLAGCEAAWQLAKAGVKVPRPAGPMKADPSIVIAFVEQPEPSNEPRQAIVSETGP